MTFTIWHNPHCSKSRQALSLLQSKGVEPDVVLYLQTPPTPDVLKSVLSKLGMRAVELVRQKEAREEGMPLEALSDNELIAFMCAHPRVIERPVVIHKERACVGRPPEKVLELFTA
ncbi:arsenate reductase (glutaredoxin) [Haematospirillum jordaniae]|uniref:Arsenate reductase n=1 Tax=Haematospirillum jordaniae TaxID=1549855 RepID=A0A143DDW5_9PROT|nr:arsenate reductase (glutaredoxin) [Haematospirillum jordaniae]AMW34463.1 arsenate reductase [Haematospirillum jordaniae]NKD44548.1 arsenate reductase (glutaredoxin) [Haematospirillum jordaniae]NKD57568.1 arsenate reductase (glutaredoxin) [Haematospirillum jordaniae]NKD59138.1 arsenate reductase (glutaredoxin) [Haematospirillum jordaniae]NKD67276.1 arsenate reductase (glutaredoxin) [Haematospirillum jordaniae]